MTECMYPDPDALGRERTEAPPEGFDEWRDPGGSCRHLFCLEAADARRTMPPTMSRAERAEMAADRELMADEFHGRWGDLADMDPLIARAMDGDR